MFGNQSIFLTASTARHEVVLTRADVADTWAYRRPKPARFDERSEESKDPFGRQ